MTATNMDTLSIPAGSGVDTTALFVGDYSDCNDATILKGDGEVPKIQVCRTPWSMLRIFFSKKAFLAKAQQARISSVCNIRTDGSVTGDTNNGNLRFGTIFMQMAVDGAL